MRLSNILFSIFRFLIPPALIFTLCLYFYAPLLDCSFPPAKKGEAGCSIPGQQRDSVPAEQAPFRLLAFGDPQLEGDTSLPTGPRFSSLERLSGLLRDGDLIGAGYELGPAVKGLWNNDIPWMFYGYRKRLDLWGNDLYLAHIYRSVSWWSQPTHVVVLGDLLGSQWIGDEEFRRRSDRFWHRVFKGTEKVPRSITESSGRVEVLGQDKDWQRRIIAVVGNHDIGYAGDIDEHRVERFEEQYGNVNWDIRFRLENTTETVSPSFGFGASPLDQGSPELHVVVLNTMNLDSPAKNLELQQESRDFADAALFHSPSSNNPKSATVLLTHIPMHKPNGICADGEYFDWFPEGGIKEQNFLLKGTSDYLLNVLAGNRKHGQAIVLNGHDHEGCDTLHFRRKQGDPWDARHYNSYDSPELGEDEMATLREITVRSMMGSFYGNTGFLSGWYDYEADEWKFEYASCPLGVQHIWWAIHVFDLIVVGLGIGSIVSVVAEEVRFNENPPEESRKKMKDL
jgi:hypothetical protein